MASTSDSTMDTMPPHVECASSTLHLDNDLTMTQMKLAHDKPVAFMVTSNVEGLTVQPSVGYFHGNENMQFVIRKPANCDVEDGVLHVTTMEAPSYPNDTKAKDFFGAIPDAVLEQQATHLVINLSTANPLNTASDGMTWTEVTATTTGASLGEATSRVSATTQASALTTSAMTSSDMTSSAISAVSVTATDTATTIPQAKERKNVKVPLASTPLNTVSDGGMTVVTDSAITTSLISRASSLRALSNGSKQMLLGSTLMASPALMKASSMMTAPSMLTASSDGMTWTDETMTEVSSAHSDHEQAPTMMVTASDDGMTLVTDNGTTSMEESAATVSAMSVSKKSAAIATASDGMTWTEVTATTTGAPSSDSSVDAKSNNSAMTNSIATASDGMTWTEVTATTTGAPSGHSDVDVKSAKSTMMTASDGGMTWTDATSTSNVSKLSAITTSGASSDYSSRSTTNASSTPSNNGMSVATATGPSCETCTVSVKKVASDALETASGFTASMDQMANVKSAMATASDGMTWTEVTATLSAMPVGSAMSANKASESTQYQTRTESSYSVMVEPTVSNAFEGDTDTALETAVDAKNCPIYVNSSALVAPHVSAFLGQSMSSRDSSLLADAAKETTTKSSVAESSEMATIETSATTTASSTKESSNPSMMTTSGDYSSSTAVEEAKNNKMVAIRRLPVARQAVEPSAMSARLRTASEPESVRIMRNAQRLYPLPPMITSTEEGKSKRASVRVAMLQYKQMRKQALYLRRQRRVLLAESAAKPNAASRLRHRVVDQWRAWSRPQKCVVDEITRLSRHAVENGAVFATPPPSSSTS